MNISPQFGRIFKIQPVLVADERPRGTKAKLNELGQRTQAERWIKQSALLRSHQALVSTVATENNLNPKIITSYQLSYKGDTFVVISTPTGTEIDPHSKRIVEALQPHSKTAQYDSMPGARFYTEPKLKTAIPDELRTFQQLVDDKKEVATTVVTGYVIPKDQIDAHPTVKITHSAVLPSNTSVPNTIPTDASIAKELFARFESIHDFFTRSASV